MKFVALLFVLSVVGSGCVASPDSGQSSAEGAAEAGSPDASKSAAKSVGVTTEVTDGAVTVGIAADDRAFNTNPEGEPFLVAFTMSPELTGVIADVTWDAMTPASEKLSVWVRLAGVGNVPPEDPMTLVEPTAPVLKVVGSSPMRVLIPAELLEAGQTYEVIVRAAAEPAGVAADQPFTLALTQFKGVAFDSEYAP